MSQLKYLVGIDEAGRGAIAGPVAVGLFAWPASAPPLEKVLVDYPFGCDSKKLSSRQRDKWYERINQLVVEHKAFYCVSLVSNSYIDRAGIVPAIKQGIKTCFDKLDILPEDLNIVLDGGLKAPVIYKDQKTIIKGDESELVISLASIAAKVVRDRKMVGLSKTYLEYGFDKHKGYGTALHYQDLAKNGQSLIHRKTFLH